MRCLNRVANVPVNALPKNQPILRPQWSEPIPSLNRVTFRGPFG